MWYISSDVIDNGEAVHQFGGADNIDQAVYSCNHQFKMLDDDGELYYVGFSDDSSSFDPLDHFGMPNAGCTEIQYLENGKWVSL